MAEPRIVVAGIALPATELADALDAYVIDKIRTERRRPVRADRRPVAFNSTPWSEAVRRLRKLGYPIASDGIGADSLPAGGLVSCTEWAGLVGVAAVTARQWAADGRITGACKTNREWLVPRDARRPEDRRRRA